MILSSMTHAEVADAIRRDFSSVFPKCLEAARRFGSAVKRTRGTGVFPFSRTYFIESRNKLRFAVTFVALKRSDWDVPQTITRTSFHYRGAFFAALVSDKDRIIIFTQHFFERYRDRILGSAGAGMSLAQVQDAFFNQNEDVLWEECTPAFARAAERYDGEDGTPQLVGRFSQGNVFAQKVDGRTVLVRTILSDEMLHEDQDEAFSKIEGMRRMVGRLSSAEDKQRARRFVKAMSNH